LLRALPEKISVFVLLEILRFAQDDISCVF